MKQSVFPLSAQTSQKMSNDTSHENMSHQHSTTTISTQLVVDAAAAFGYQKEIIIMELKHKKKAMDSKKKHPIEIENDENLKQKKQKNRVRRALRNLKEDIPWYRFASSKPLD